MHRWIVVWMVLFSVMLCAGCSNPFTPAGFEGFVYENPRVFGKGGFRGIIKGPGNYGASVWRNEVINIDIRPQTYVEGFKVLAKDDLNVSFRIDYPDIVAAAVEKKLAAQQLLEEKEVQREIAKKDAEIKIEEAKGIAEAQRIINSTLTANYLQHEAIQAQLTMANSPNHTTVYIPSGTNGIPLVKTVK